MKWRAGRGADRQFDDRLIWQAASLLLDYPDEQFDRQLDAAEQILTHLPPDRTAGLMQVCRELRAADRYAAATAYVDTFDLRRRTTLLLTYWTAGDTRNRGREMLRFVEVYRGAGMTSPAVEAPDHLAVVLEFAATVDPQAGAELLAAFAVPIRTLRTGLEQAQSPYLPVLDAVCATLPVPSAADEERAARLAAAGPPAEAVGLEPFTLTVPPRRQAGESERRKDVV